MIVVDNTDDAVKYSEAIILLPNHLSLAHQWEGVVRNAGISIFAHNHWWFGDGGGGGEGGDSGGEEYRNWHICS